MPIRISRRQFFLLVLIMAIFLATQTRVLDLSKPEVKESSIDIYYKESLLSAGLKADTPITSTIQGCEIVEPAYAQLKCIHKESGLGGTRESLSLTSAAGINENDPRFVHVSPVVTIVKTDGTQAPKELAGGVFGGFYWAEGEVYRINWQKISSTFNVRRVVCEKCSEEFILDIDKFRIALEDYQGNIFLWYDGSEIFWDDDPYERNGQIISNNIRYVYVYTVNRVLTKPTFIVGTFPVAILPGTKPAKPGDWELQITADDEYLEFSIAGSLRPSRVEGSFGCSPPGLANMMANIKDPVSGRPVTTHIQDDKEELTQVVLGVINEVTGRGGQGIVTSSEPNLERADTLYLNEPPNFEDYDPAILRERGTGLDKDGDAINWPYLYRSTGIIDGVLLREYKGEQVLCDQNLERLIGFVPIPQTQAQEDADVCYTLPGKEVEWDGSSDDVFACDSSFCTVFGAAIDKPKYDAENFKCVEADVVVTGKPCIGTGEAQCQRGEIHQPVAASPGNPVGGCYEFTEYCREDSGAPRGFDGFCELNTAFLPVCCPGDVTVNGLCNEAGTGYVEIFRPKTECPANACCFNDARYLDSGIPSNEYGCPIGTLCCADMSEGDTFGTCSDQCEADIVSPIVPPRTIKEMAEDFIEMISDALGLSPELAKLIGLILLGLLILIIVIFLINTISGMLGGGGLLGGFGGFGGLTGGRGGGGGGPGGKQQVVIYQPRQ